MVATPSQPPRPATRADLDDLPEGVKGEIIDGVLYTQPRPRSMHQHVIASLGDDLRGPFQRGHGGPGGWLILPEPGIVLPGAPEVSPDLAGWRRTRLAALPDAPIDVVPDWVCEVLSPSTRRTDLVVKRAFYARVGVPFCWYVDVEARAVTVSRLENGRWVELGVFGPDATLRAEPFEAVEVDVKGWWAE